MDTMKTFFIYALCIVGFIILSELLINVGLNSLYKDINRIDNIKQVEIYQAEATSVNGRIRGIVKNTDTEDLSGKYIKLSFYSQRDVLLGNKYIQIENLNEKELQSFELFFKVKNVSYYEISITDQKEEYGEIEWLPNDLRVEQVLVLTLFTYLILI